MLIGQFVLFLPLIKNLSVKLFPSPKNSYTYALSVRRLRKQRNSAKDDKYLSHGLFFCHKTGSHLTSFQKDNISP